MSDIANPIFTINEVDIYVLPSGFFRPFALDSEGLFREIAAPNRSQPMNSQSAPTAGRQIAWPSVITVISAAILIGAEVFGAAFAGGWALAGLFHLGETGGYVLQSIFFVIGLVIMASFIRAARRVEPFTG